MHATKALLLALLLTLPAIPCLAQDLDGGPGDDTLTVGESDTYNNVHGGLGSDTITNHGTVNIDIFGGDGATPGDGNDVITNWFTVTGSIYGEDGDDTIENHFLVNDSMDGGNGNDVLLNYGGARGMVGGAGNDSLVNDDTVATDMEGGDGDDTLVNTYWGWIVGNMLGGTGSDSLSNDGIVELSLDGGTGNDVLVNEYWGEIGGNMIGGDDDDSLTNKGLVIGDFLGGAGNDVLLNVFDAWIDGNMDGGDGDDVLTNYDMVQGGLLGGAGNDVIMNHWSEWGGAGFISGGAGDDVIFNSGYVDLEISGGDGNDVITNVMSDGGGAETISGGAGNDRILNSGYVDWYIEGNDGDDIIEHSGDYVEEIFGDAGNDDITVSSDVWGVIFGDESSGNIPGTTDTLHISGGINVTAQIGEFESIFKTGPGAVRVPTLDLDNADVSVEMFESSPQFVINTLQDVGGDLTVSILGGRWADGQVVDVFSTGQDAGWTLETISDASTFVDFTLVDGQVTATRVASYTDFLDPGDPNGRRMAQLLDDLVNNGSGDLDLLFSILDFMDPSRLSELLDQLGPTLGGAMQDRGFAASQLMWTVLANRPSLGGGQAGNTGLTLSLTGAGGASGSFDPSVVRQLSQGFAQVLNGRSAPDQDLASALENGQALGRGLVLADSLALGAAADEELGPLLALTGQDFGLWMRLMVQGLESEERGESAAYDATLLGLAAGFDMRLSEHWQAGLHGFWSSQDLKLDDAGGSSASGRIVQLGTSLSYADGPLALEATLGVFNSWWQTERRIVYGALDRTAEANVSASGVAASVGGEYDFQVDQVHLTPMARVEFLHQRQAAYTESGAGDLNLRIDAVSSTSLRTSLGGRISADLEIDAGDKLIELTPEVHALWRHEFANDSTDLRCEFTGGGSFQSATPDPDRDTVLIGAGITLGRQDSPSLYLTGDVEWGEHSVGYGGAVGFRIPF